MVYVFGFLWLFLAVLTIVIGLLVHDLGIKYEKVMSELCDVHTEMAKLRREMKEAKKPLSWGQMPPKRNDNLNTEGNGN